MDDYEQLVRRAERARRMLAIAKVAIPTVLVGAFVVVFGLWLVARHDHDGKIRDCTARGVKHFREIGSYPRLKAYPEAGRLAEDVAHERCRRTLTAFGE